MCSPMALSNLTLSDLEKPKSRSLLSGSRSVWYTSVCLRLITTLIWMSQKGSLLAAGFSAVPAVFLVFAFQLPFTMQCSAWAINLLCLKIYFQCPVFSTSCLISDPLIGRGFESRPAWGHHCWWDSLPSLSSHNMCRERVRAQIPVYVGTTGVLMHIKGCIWEQPPRGVPWVSGLVGHFFQTWPDSECSHTVQFLDCSDLNWRSNHYHPGLALRS